MAKKSKGPSDPELDKLKIQVGKLEAKKKIKELTPHPKPVWKRNLILLGIGAFLVYYAAGKMVSPTVMQHRVNPVLAEPLGLLIFGVFAYWLIKSRFFGGEKKPAAKAHADSHGGDHGHH